MRPRWTGVGGLGVAAIGASTLLHWAVTSGPVGLLAVTGPPLLLWLGLVLAAAGVAAGAVRPELAPTPVAGTTLAGALLTVAAALGDAGSATAGPAPWLALGGALVVGTAAVTALTALAARHVIDDAAATDR